MTMNLVKILSTKNTPLKEIVMEGEELKEFIKERPELGVPKHKIYEKTKRIINRGNLLLCSRGK